MKSRLQSAVSWMSQKLKNKTNETDQPQAEVTAEVPADKSAEDSGKIMAFVSTVAAQSQVQAQSQVPAQAQSGPVPAAVAPAPVAKVRRPDPVEEAPRKPMTLADLTAGPEIKVVVRGAKHYGVCPHCEATWNIRERLSHPTFRRADNSKGLTCPNCDKSVGLPPQTDLRKLS